MLGARHPQMPNGPQAPARTARFPTGGVLAPHHFSNSVIVDSLYLLLLPNSLT